MPFGPIESPNLVLFVTDQQRSIQHFPPAWVEANLPNLEALRRSGLCFDNAITNASRCSPSRGVLMTSLYAPTNQLVDVGGTLSGQWTTLGQRLASARPDMQIGYVGKWHMTSAFTGPAATRPNPESTLDAENQLMDRGYRMPGWNAPDAGTALGWTASTPPNDASVEDPYVSSSNTLGGGPRSRVRNDARIADDAMAFLLGLDPDRPFALIVSLVNPHDVWVDMYAGLLAQAFPEFPAAFESLEGADAFALPDSYSEDDLSTKPQVQARTRDDYTQTWADGHDLPVPPDNMLGEAEALTYLKFYAYLTHLADRELGRVYAALQAHPRFDDTIVVRLADHGEMGMSHGGSMEKDANVYAETISIPYIFSNPKLFPEPRRCAAQAGLVDVVPTLLGILGEPLAAGEVQGSDLSKLLLEPEAEPPHDCSIFTYDDMSPWHIRAIQVAAGGVEVGGKPSTHPYKYAVYYELSSGSYGHVDPGSLELELYVPGEDGEIDNLAPNNPMLVAALHRKLTRRMAKLDATGPCSGGTLTPAGWPTHLPAPPTVADTEV